MILSALFSLASGIALTRKDAKALEVTFAALGLHGVVGLLNAASFKDGYDAAGTALFTTIAILYFLKSKRVAATYKPLTK
jgi:hypothetical protein